MREIRALRAYAEVALGRQRSPQNDSGPHMTRYLRAANVKDGQLDLTDVKEMNFEPKEQQLFTLRPGDVLVTEGSGSLGSVGASAVWGGELSGTVCFQNTLLRLRPRSQTDGRFLAWWCRHAFADGLFASVATGANIFHLSAERVRSLPMVYLPLQRQRAIADFLDTETARIDALITKKRRMIDLLEERRQTSIDGAIEGAGTLVSVRHLVSRITSGPRGWSDRTGTHGVPFLRITNVQRTSIALDRRELLRVDDPGTAEAARTRVVSGDVLVSITADIGSVGVATDEDHGGFVSQHIALITPTGCESEWLAYAIKSTSAQQALDSGQYGGTKTQLSLGDIAGLKVPYPGLEIRSQRLRALRAKVAMIESARHALVLQLGLLAEHRQALITAAVTGELEVPGVAA